MISLQSKRLSIITLILPTRALRPREPGVTLQIRDRELGGWTVSLSAQITECLKSQGKENAALINGVKSPKQLQNKGRTGCYGHCVDTRSTPRRAGILPLGPLGPWLLPLGSQRCDRGVTCLQTPLVRLLFLPRPGPRALTVTPLYTWTCTLTRRHVARESCSMAAA